MDHTRLLRVNRSLEVAQRVLEAVNARLETLTDGDEIDYITNHLRPVLESYQNGREQGYSIVVTLPGSRLVQISFSENRNSDDIVVYIGDYTTQGISENAYWGRRYFLAGCYDEAAGYIVEYMLGRVPWEFARYAW